MRMFFCFIFALICARCTSTDLCQCKTTCHFGLESEDHCCNCDNGSNDSYTVNVHVQKSKRMKFNCSSISNDRWHELVKGINVTDANNKYTRIPMLTMIDCPLPEESIGSILKHFAIEKIRDLQLRFNQKRNDVFSNYTFKNLDSVEQLECSGYSGKTLPETLFTGLSNLKNLNFSNSSLSSIPAELFMKVPKIENLYLNYNHLESLKKGTFSRLPKLSRLLLNHNKIEILELGVFHEDSENSQALSNLRELDLSFNKLMDLNTTSFYGLVKLEMLLLQNNRLSFIAEGTFHKLKNLQHLSLSENNLMQLPGLLFQYCELLQVLDISFNKLVAVNESLFRNPNALKKLFLQNNNLTHTSENAYRDLSSLEELQLENNNLTFLPIDSIFGDLKNLRIINAANNRLGPVDYSRPTSFVTLIGPTVEKIYLQHNFINGIPMWIRLDPNNTHLKTVDLSYNKLTQQSITEAIENLGDELQGVEVILGNNPIETFDFSNLEETSANHSSNQSSPGTGRGDFRISFKNNTFRCDCSTYNLLKYAKPALNKNMSKYVTLDLSEVTCTEPEELRGILSTDVKLFHIQCPLNKYEQKACPTNCSCSWRPDDETAVVNCSHLGNLPRDFSKLQNFSIGRFKGIDLLLSHNNLRSLYEVKLPNNTVILNVSWNKLTDINGLNFPFKLKELFLDNNELSLIDGKTVEKIRYMNVTLHNNPWKCECENKHLFSFIRNHAPSSKMKITCGDSGRSIDDEFELCIGDLIRLIFIAAILSICFIISIMTAVFYKYEKEIKQWMFIHDVLRWIVTEEELDRDKQYDAFISYSQWDFDYVAQIQDFLENEENGFKLCLHDRNWMIGVPIMESINESVANSRRTIILASRKFLNSDWCLKEFRAAYEQNENDGPRRLIVILLEDDISIDDDIVNEKFQIYLRENTYLKWSDPRFWGKLKHSMPHPQIKGYMKKQLAFFIHHGFATIKRTIMKTISSLFSICKQMKTLLLCLKPVDVEKQEKISRPLLTDSETNFGKFEYIHENDGTFSIQIPKTKNVPVNHIWYGDELIYYRNGGDLT